MPRFLGQLLGEQETVAGFIMGQPQAAQQAVLRVGQRGLHPGQPGTVQHLVRHTAGAQHLQVTRHGIELRLRAKHLKRAAGALLVLDAGVSTQLLQAGAAVL